MEEVGFVALDAMMLAAVEWGYICTPLDILLDLELEPLKLLSAAAVLAAAKYVLEHCAGEHDMDVFELRMWLVL
ncbi:hypothetical protein AK812_SmicGene47235, partial [Symbiodinium microadriaticum]